MPLEVAVIGAGLVGLSSAWQLARLDVRARITVFEKEAALAQHQSGRNSGVVHSGIYYKPGSLKAETCRRGRDLLESFCDQRGVPFERRGKLIVATAPDQIDELERLLACGLRNGVAVERLSGGQARRIEPGVAARAALWVAETGIVDYPAVARALAEDLTGRGHSVHTGQAVERIEPGPGLSLQLRDGSRSTFDLVINCAGLQADRLARSLIPDLNVRIVPFRGQYYRLIDPARFVGSALIYPVPNPRLPFLGVHLTPTLAGEVLCGPNAVLALGREAYSGLGIDLGEVVGMMRHPGFRRMALSYWRAGLQELRRAISPALFAAALAELVPGIKARDLAPARSGIRAQAVDERGRLLDDFVLRSGGGTLHVISAPSPAATACLAIGEMVAQQVLRAWEEH